MGNRKAKATSVPRVAPTKDYTPEEREAIVDYVAEEIVKKRSLYKILSEDEGMPNYGTFMRWTQESETFNKRIAQAREAALEAIIEEIIEISDDTTGDAYIWTDPKTGRQYAKQDGDNVQRAKLKVYAREKVAAMLAPRRFGTQRMDVTSDGKAISNETNVTLVENRVASILMMARRRIDQQEELKSIIDVEATPQNA